MFASFIYAIGIFYGFCVLAGIGFFAYHWVKKIPISTDAPDDEEVYRKELKRAQYRENKAYCYGNYDW